MFYFDQRLGLLQIHYLYLSNYHLRQHLLNKAGIRYRNPYQTRHTFASMMLSSGENMLWLAKQMGHRDTEMIIKTYGKWIPDPASKAGYTPVNNWGQALIDQTSSISQIKRIRK